jgi:hypothetical protein
MAATKLKLGLTALVIAGAATTMVIQYQMQATLREENQSLHQQIKQLDADNVSLSNRLAQAKKARGPRLPAPPVQLTTRPAEPAEDSQSTNLFARFPGLKAKAPNKLSAGQVESYLKANGRNAASLLAAYRTTGDHALLEQAMQEHGNDPQVALEAALREDASPEDRHQWLETLKQSDSANALPNYLSAFDYFKAGQTDQAVQELVAASGKQQFEDYSAQRVRDNEQAYLAAGYSVAEAKAISPLQQAMYFGTSEDEVEATFAPFQSQLTQLQQVKELYLDVCDLAKSYKQAGDQASAQAALQITVNLGQRYSNALGEDGLSRLAGIGAEVNALYAMDPNSPCDSNGQTVQDRMTQLRQQKTAILGLYKQGVPLLGTMSDQDWISYGDRARIFGEPAAIQWVVGKYGQK